MEASRLVIFFTSIIVTYLLVDVLKILLAKKLNNKLTPRRITLFKKGISFLLIIFGLILILRGLIPKEIGGIEKNLENVSYKVDNF